MIRLNGEKLKRYELDRTVTVAPRHGNRLYEVRASKSGEEVLLNHREENGEIVAEIPNAFLEHYGTITVEVVSVDEHRFIESEKKNFVVYDNEKPADYTYKENIAKGGGGGDGAQANWNAAEGEAGHVLNRTHYEYSTFGEFVPETTVALDPEEGTGLIDTAVELEAGNDYLVVYNGVEYTTACVEVVVNGITMVGMGAVGTITGEGSTEEPFIIANGSAMGLAGLLVMGVPDDEGNCTLSISGRTTEIKKLDNKFIDAEWLATVGQEQFVGEILPESTVESGLVGSGFDHTKRASNLDKIKEGDNIRVVWDGTAYECLVIRNTTTPLGDLLYCGNGAAFMVLPDTGEPFMVLFGVNGTPECSVSIATEDGEGSDHTVSITAVPGVSVLPEKFLPATVPTITTAEVGQTIVVKTVDSAGKPTAWEAVDPAPYFDLAALGLPAGAIGADESCTVSEEVGTKIRDAAMRGAIKVKFLVNVGVELEMEAILTCNQLYGGTGVSGGLGGSFVTVADGNALMISFYFRSTSIGVSASLLATT